MNITIRKKRLKNGDQSIYLDIYQNGIRKYEFLGLRLTRDKFHNKETLMLAEKIKQLTVTLKRKTHDDGRLYGAVNGAEVSDLLAKQGISIAKNQVEFGKSIKATGIHKVTIKLSSKLQPQLTLKVTAEK